MPNKCAVAGGKTGYLSDPKKPMFKFASKISLWDEWIEFLNRKDYTQTPPHQVFVLIISKKNTYFIIHRESDVIILLTPFQISTLLQHLEVKQLFPNQLINTY